MPNFLQQLQNNISGPGQFEPVLYPGGGSVFGPVNGGTGTGPVLVNGGAVSGGGTISGTNTPGTTTTPGTVLNPTGNTTPGNTTTIVNPATPVTTPNTTTTTTAPTGQGVDAAPVSPAKVWYQDWKTWAIAGVAIASIYFMYTKAHKK